MPPPLDASLVALFRRRSDLGDELPSPACYAAAGARGHSTFDRVRCDRAKGPVPVSCLGLDGSLEWHRSARSPYRADDGGGEGGERALCVQTTTDVEGVRRFEASSQGEGRALRKRLDDPMRPGCWGENLHLDGGEGFSAGGICVGDEFSVFRPGGGDEPVLVTQVSMPRRPCSKVDAKFGKTFTANGVRCHCARTGRAGFFLRVVRPGTLLEGDSFRLTARPNPGWTLARVQRLLYGSESCQMAYLRRGVLREEWTGTRAELEELADVLELGVCEYREEVFRMIPGRPAIGRYAPGKEERFAGGSWGWFGLLPRFALLGAVLFALLPLVWCGEQQCAWSWSMALGLASFPLLFRRSSYF